ncbi:HD-GYP domain-containing protein [Clostridium sp. P21]|uniref:HD-GYP domain-containing protein n=1 Tax=Clostridium muellerianum TaxID=2716538 RepID=A0A7Y0EEG1_9CLOT|nr:HD-GYP domain-containing protein [Clostridium muellerianum]NMM61989.1 HD-GYP domain-containing protein [Clostridium muellerianum]
MRFELVRNLKGDEILGKTLFDGYGKVLLPSGTKLNTPYINRIKQSGFYYIYIEDKELDDIKEDKKIDQLKQSTIERLPNVFTNIMQGNKDTVEESFKIVEDLAGYIATEGDVNTNLYEISKYDNYTYIHCVDTAIMSIFLGRSLDLKIEDLTELGISAMLHDIGKIKISNEIINKKEPLTKQEFEEIKKHPVYGYRMLKEAGVDNKNILSAVVEHHERVNGKGYPLGISGDKVSDYAKIISVCDVFTALSANRSYRERYNPNEAYEYIISNGDIMFDTKIVEKFKENFFIYPLGCCVKLSNGIEGYVVKQNKYFPDRPVIRVNYDHITKEKINSYEIDLLTTFNTIIESLVY